MDRPIYLEAEGCPVSLDLLGRVYRADAEKLLILIADIPEKVRARLAAYLYGRSHTHELGLKVGATCTMAALSGVEGPLGAAIYAQSRQTYARPTHGETRPTFARKVSLAGSLMKGDSNA
ncbi:hypothetical protein [Methylobacterium sp. J-068]|uniref:hypothetical protein n=1 Tax=Methylobacterium sp. J-068 TaxID=2836649 RepID=UPI001FB95F5D|nr:hypothetical protein [Methylobacterium sp. J-068]MCJ2034625.1 hypothetical protein [Methylobacterium sp. J-068]